MRILFLDVVSRTPYDPNTLTTRALGGSESSLVRLAERLAVAHRGDARRFVAVAQRARFDTVHYNAHYGPLLPEWLSARWDAVVAFRAASILGVCRDLFPSSRLILWLQDLADNGLSVRAIATTKPLIVTASSFHAQNVSTYLACAGCREPLQIVNAFNPIDDDLAPVGTTPMRDKLMFASSPNKGLDWTLQVFEKARLAQPEFELHVANPGYREWAKHEQRQEGVHWLGALSHRDVTNHMRSSLCILYLNDVCFETFGCVLAEANAVGTPVLTHPGGAAPEVLHHPDQFIDVRDSHAVVERLIRWRSGGRPVVGPDDRFRVSRVATQWEGLLAS